MPVFNMTNHLFVCDCGDVDHQFIISQPPPDYYEPEEEPELYLHIHLSHGLTFFERLKYVLLYLFGKQSKYGAFGEIILKREHIIKLNSICEDFLANE